MFELIKANNSTQAVYPYLFQLVEIPRDHGWPLMRLWLGVFECVCNPLWFPLACTCLVPIVTLALLRVEASRDHRTTDNETGLYNSKESQFRDVKGHGSCRKKLLLGILLVYYAVFVHDLLSYGSIMDRDDKDGPNLDFTHTERQERVQDEKVAIHCVYLFKHWTVLAASVARTIIWWRLDDRII